MKQAPLSTGTLHFSVEGRLLRELGERLVKEPEVALVELIKNAYDADATLCEVTISLPELIEVRDTGHGMTLDEFTTGWMRIGTSSKESEHLSRGFNRVITGEKGIGRFAVRFLGTQLDLTSVAFDRTRGIRTRLEACFDWPTFDRTEDIGQLEVPYALFESDSTEETGTTLTVTGLRAPAFSIDLNKVRTATISVVTPLSALLSEAPELADDEPSDGPNLDPGFSLRIEPSVSEDHDGEVAAEILIAAVLRAVLKLDGNRLSLRVFSRGETEPIFSISDTISNFIGPLYADLRFFPQRKGTFTSIPVDGRRAKSWVRDNSGVAVFDRTFRVLPYGTPGDDWLRLDADTARNSREPRSSLAKKYFPMDEATRSSTKTNYMLRLPYSQQLIGLVQVRGQRTRDQQNGTEGLIAAADREGFVDNPAFRQLYDIVRGAVEAIAAADRELQLRQERAEREAALRTLRAETRQAIREVESNPHIRTDDKSRIVERLAQSQVLAEKHEERTRETEERLEIMSLLGVIAGFMTHEFGTALHDLETAHRELVKLAHSDISFKAPAERMQGHIVSLREFVTYSQGYVRGASVSPVQPYEARPRLQQVLRVFGRYAKERSIEIDVDIDPDLMAPLVPVSLYNGLALNLYTNALKAVVAKTGSARRAIIFRAWNDVRWHHFQVCDTGVGIPLALRTRVFDPLFTTTSSNDDPLGSGMGLGLSLVKRAVEAFGGRVEVIDPPAEFSTCVYVRLPLT